MLDGLLQDLNEQPHPVDRKAGGLPVPDPQLRPMAPSRRIFRLEQPRRSLPAPVRDHPPRGAEAPRQDRPRVHPRALRRSQTSAAIRAAGIRSLPSP